MTQIGKQYENRVPKADLIRERDLAERWGLTRRTLQRWRGKKIGPSYLRLGNRILYRLEDVHAYEQCNRTPSRQV